MKTYAEIKDLELKNLYSKMAQATKRLEEGNYNGNHQQKGEEMIIKDYSTYIDNIDEVVAFKIGQATNSLIKGFQEAYKAYNNEYFKNFSDFVDKYIRGIAPDGTMKNGMFYCQSECYFLGIGINELLCFKENDPLQEETGDLLRTIVNANYGTKIPMASEVKQAETELANIAFSENKYSADEYDVAFIRAKEIQFNSGNKGLNVLSPECLLATDEAYQRAIARHHKQK